MAGEQFNPFEDRLSRDIRNDLSETVADVLARRSLAPARAVADRYRAAGLAPPYEAYLATRLRRYEAVLDALGPGHGLLRQAAALWDERCFFEVHEILEPPWIAASGAEKRLLQALIRAAGVYVKLEAGQRRQAEKIAAKALPVLVELGAALAPELRIEKLIEALEQLSDTPPKLT